MDSKQLIESFADFAKTKSMDRPTMMRILEDTFRAIIKKQYGADENFDIVINPDNGDLVIWRVRTVVDDDSEDIWDHDKISLSEARQIEPDFEIDEEVSESLNIAEFGRRNVQAIRQTLIQKVKEWEKEQLYNAYKDRVGDLITAEVYQPGNREILLSDEEGNDLVMPRSETIPKDRFRKGDHTRGIIKSVEMINGSPRIVVSRASPVFLERLFELEVPEVADGLIGIRKIVREPGERAKVAVESYDDRIDPVGACVGMKGSRIHAVVRELENENIDVINFTTNTELFIQRALSPAKITSMRIDDETKRVSVFLRPDQVSLAIGKSGHNIKLAGKLVGMEIDVFRDQEEQEDQDDIDLQEFDDEIEQWIIDELKRVGLDTARSVLAMSPGDLVRRTELEEENVAEVFEILQREFEEGQSANTTEQ